MNLGVLRSAEDWLEEIEQLFKRPLTAQERRWLRLGKQSLRTAEGQAATPTSRSKLKAA